MDEVDEWEEDEEVLDNASHCPVCDVYGRAGHAEWGG